MAEYVFLHDAGNYRIVKKNAVDWSYVGQFGETGIAGEDSSHLGSLISDTYMRNILCTDGTFLYVWDYGNYRIIKINAITMIYDSSYGSQGSGDDQLGGAGGICTDNTYLYISDANNHRIVKRRCSDLGFDSKVDAPGYAADKLQGGRSIATDGIYLYVGDQGGPTFIGQIAKWTIALTWVSSVNHDRYPEAIATDGTYIYYGDSWSYDLFRRTIALGAATTQTFSNNVYPALTYNSGCLYFREGFTISKRSSIPPYVLLASYGSLGSGQDQFVGTVGIAFATLIEPPSPPSSITATAGHAHNTIDWVYP